MLSCELLAAMLLCHACVSVQLKACQHFADRIRSEVVWVVQEAREQLKVYSGLKQAAKVQEVMVSTPDFDTVCLPSMQCLLCVMTCVLVTFQIEPVAGVLRLCHLCKPDRNRILQCHKV